MALQVIKQQLADFGLNFPDARAGFAVGMNPRSDIHDRLAASLREARRTRGLSLDAVAKLSGVSRSMVSQIERGESSPTVATLWNLTQALQVDFAGLLDARKTPLIEVIRAEAAPVIGGRGQGVSIRILSRAEAVGMHEVYDLTFAEGGKLISDAPLGKGQVIRGDRFRRTKPGFSSSFPERIALRRRSDAAPSILSRRWT